MDAVGDVVNRYLVSIDARPQKLPHLTRNISMQATHAILLARHAYCQYGHTKGWTPAMIFASYLHKLLAVESKLSPEGAEVLVDEIVAECIVACRYGRMCCEE